MTIKDFVCKHKVDMIFGCRHLGMSISEIENMTGISKGKICGVLPFNSLYEELSKNNNPSMMGYTLQEVKKLEKAIS